MLATLGIALALLQSPTDGSVEKLLEQARTARDASATSVAPGLNGLIDELEAETPPGKLSLDRIHTELDRMGPEAASLLVPLLDPGTGKEATLVFRAQEVTKALVRLRPAGIVSELIRASGRGSKLARLNAIRVLSAIPEKKRAGAYLARLFDLYEDELRLEAARGLAAQGGHQDVLRRALTDDDPRIIATVLESLTQSASADVAEAVFHLTEATAAAAPVAAQLVGYWRAVPEAADERVLEALLQLASRVSVPDAARIQVLEALPDFEEAKSRSFRQKLEPLLDGAQPILIREAALVCSTLLGDRSSRRKLLETYDDTIDEDKEYWKGYRQRGDVLMRIQDYSAAARDYEKGIEMLQKNRRSTGTAFEELCIELARAQVFNGKLKQAADAIEDARLTDGKLERLRSDPDFAPLLESSRHGKVLNR